MHYLNTSKHYPKYGFREDNVRIQMPWYNDETAKHLVGT